MRQHLGNRLKEQQSVMIRVRQPNGPDHMIACRATECGEEVGATVELMMATLSRHAPDEPGKTYLLTSF